MKTVIFVHGFGKMKDARGMFTDIVTVLSASEINCILIDLNTRDGDGNILLSTFSKQVEILTETYRQNKSNETYIIAHSQGCIVSALANLPNIVKTLFLAPPTDNNATKTIEYFKRNPLTTINLDGISKLARRDGTFTIVSSQYWTERESINLSDLYTTYCKNNLTTVVKATQDEVITNESFEDVFQGTETIEIEANHDFTGAGKEKMIMLCERLVI